MTISPLRSVPSSVMVSTCPSGETLRKAMATTADLQEGSGSLAQTFACTTHWSSFGLSVFSWITVWPTCSSPMLVTAALARLNF